MVNSISNVNIPVKSSNLEEQSNPNAVSNLGLTNIINNENIEVKQSKKITTLLHRLPSPSSKSRKH